jgi:predicted transcriptional regulator
MKFDEYKEKQLKNPEIKKEYDDLAAEYDIINALITCRKELNITQVQLSERTGIPQADLSRLESGRYNPSIKFLKRVANGMGKQLHISFK